MRQGVVDPAKHVTAERPPRVRLAVPDTGRTASSLHRFVKDVPTDPSHPSWPHLLEVEAGLASLKDKPTLLPWGVQDWCFGRPFLEEFQSAHAVGGDRRTPRPATC